MVHRATAARRVTPVVRGKVALRSNELDLDALGLDLDALMPTSILGDLEGLQEESGAVFDDDGVPLNFGDADAEAEILRTKVGIVDRSGGWKILRLAGPDAVAALKSAGATGEDIEALMSKEPGAGMPIDLDGDRIAAHVMGGGMLVTAPVEVADKLMENGGDAVTDLAEQCTLLSLVGPDAAELLVRSGAPGVMEQDVGTHAVFGFEDTPVVAAYGGDLLAEVASTDVEAAALDELSDEHDAPASDAHGEEEGVVEPTMTGRISETPLSQWPDREPGNEQPAESEADDLETRV